jgi:hypothetical protein
MTQSVIASSLPAYTQERDLPVTPNAIKTRFIDMMDGYIAVFNGDCSELIYCSYLGGSDNDADGRCYLSARTRISLWWLYLPTSRDLPVNWYGMGRGCPR